MTGQKTHKLTLYNDDIHSYSYVIACLIRFCGHDPIQAEQSAIIANNNGKCHIKSGDFMELYELQDAFSKVNIKTEVEAYESSVY